MDEADMGGGENALKTLPENRPQNAFFLPRVDPHPPQGGGRIKSAGGFLAAISKIDQWRRPPAAAPPSPGGAPLLLKLVIGA